jgi:signal transduction histidine kinase
VPGFRASARTVDLLGRQQIAGIPTAISELFKNAHDAYAQRVEVDLLRPQNLLVLRDDGIGMTEEDFVERWLTLGTESKVQGAGLGRPPKPAGAVDRPVLGEKGIGRLAIASIGPQALIVTRARRGTKLHKPIVALINWTLFEIPGLKLDDILVPIHQLAAGALPDVELVKAMATEVLENLHAVAPVASAELVARATNQLEELTVDPAALDRLLREPTLSGEGQGTQFFVSPVEASLTADLDAESTEWGSSDVKRTLIGFANTMTPGHADERIATAFRDHRSAELVTNVIGPDEFFTPEEFGRADHHIQGAFDEYGQFTGTVAVFDQEPQEHRVPWPDARGRVLDCGPFRLDLAVVQGERAESLLDRDTWVELTRKMNAIGGLYIYRDAIRILPYGNADNDFLEIERNRTKQASRYYFSYRRMFGVVELDAAQNRALQEKAGREGFLDNRAYRQFRDVLRNFFVRTAFDYFAIEGSASSVYHETRDQLQEAHREAERKEKLKRQRRRAFAVELETRFRRIQDGLPEKETALVLAKLDDQLAAAAADRDTGHATEEFVRAEIEARRSLERVRAEYRLPAPRGLGLARAMRNEAASYSREFQRLEQEVIQPAAQQIDVLVATRSEDLQLALDRRLRLEALIDDVARRALATVSRSARDARESARVVAEGVDQLAKVSRRELETVINEVRAEIARLDVSSLAESELVERRLRLEGVLDRTVDHEQDLLGAVIEQLASVALSRNEGGDALTALQAQEHQEDKLLALEDRADVDLEMATQGLAIQVINHEFAHSIAAVRENLKRLSAWSQVNPDLRRLYGDIRASFDHLDGYLRLFTPMQRRLNRRRETITGGDVITYLEDVFRRAIDEAEEQGGVSPLHASSAFRQHGFVGYRSTFYPVFVNLVDNALYWAERSATPPHIELGVRGEMMTVCDNGPGIEPRHRDQVFEMGWTLKPGGRGAGLNISRQVLHAENWTLDVVASESGACLGLEPRADPNTSD